LQVVDNQASIFQFRTYETACSKNLRDYLAFFIRNLAFLYKNTMKIKTSTAVSVFGCKRIGPAQGRFATGAMTASFVGNVQSSSPKKITRRDDIPVLISMHNN
jgi:hypothetical protein